MLGATAEAAAASGNSRCNRTMGLNRGTTDIAEMGAALRYYGSSSTWSVPNAQTRVFVRCGGNSRFRPEQVKPQGSRGPCVARHRLGQAAVYLLAPFRPERA